MRLKLRKDTPQPFEVEAKRGTSLARDNVYPNAHIRVKHNFLFEKKASEKAFFASTYLLTREKKLDTIIERRGLEKHAIRLYGPEVLFFSKDSPPVYRHILWLETPQFQQYSATSTREKERSGSESVAPKVMPPQIVRDESSKGDVLVSLEEARRHHNKSERAVTRARERLHVMRSVLESVSLTRLGETAATCCR
jgi:hypothetical protein